MAGTCLGARGETDVDIGYLEKVFDKVQCEGIFKGVKARDRNPGLVERI